MFMMSAVRLQPQRDMAHLEQQLQKRRDQRIIVDAPHQKILLTQSSVVAQPALQILQQFHVDLVQVPIVSLGNFFDPALFEIFVFRVGARLILLGDKHEYLDHVLELYGIEQAVSVHVKYLEAD